MTATTKARTWKTADEVAALFARGRDGETQSQRGWWLSQKQTAWLVGQAQREGSYAEHTAHGQLPSGASWTCRVSPINGCGFFNIGKDAPTMQAEYDAEKAARIAALREAVEGTERLLDALPTLTPGQQDALASMMDVLRPKLERDREELRRLEDVGYALRQEIAQLEWVERDPAAWTDEQRARIRRSGSGYIKHLLDEYRAKLARWDAEHA